MCGVCAYVCARMCDVCGVCMRVRPCVCVRVRPSVRVCDVCACGCVICVRVCDEQPVCLYRESWQGGGRRLSDVIIHSLFPVQFDC